jgi:hypothetical protein
MQQLQPLWPSSAPSVGVPVRLPPGRFRLTTSPTSTGSSAIAMTVGT